jgi:hypothetical protein
METKPYPVRCAWLRHEILKFLNINWQTSALIAAQIIWPPEVCEREQENRSRRDGCKKRTPAGNQSGLVSSILSSLAKTGKCERRKVSSPLQGSKAAYEYRSNQPLTNRKGSILECVRQAVEDGVDPYTIKGIRKNTVTCYLWRINKEKQN